MGSESTVCPGGGTGQFRVNQGTRKVWQDVKVRVAGRKMLVEETLEPAGRWQIVVSINVIYISDA